MDMALLRQTHTALLLAIGALVAVVESGRAKETDKVNFAGAFAQLDEDGSIFSATIDRRDTKNVQHIGRSYGLAQRIRAFIACGTRSVVDDENVVTSVGDY